MNIKDKKTKKISFPNGFLWGGAISAEQTEGRGITPKAETVYERWFKEQPKDFFGEIGSNITIDITKRYKEDIAMWKELGINSLRTSISWARIYPNGMTKEPSKEGIKFYRDYFQEMLDNGIKPIATLFHFDMPIYEQEKGGWESREVWFDFLEYSKTVLNELSDIVKIWTTMNEPWVPAEASYLKDVQYPKLNNDQSGVNAAYGIVMSHALVVNYFNEELKEKFKDIKIGGIFNSAIVYPKDPNNIEDIKAAKYMDLFEFSGLTDPMVMGKWPEGMKEWLLEMDLFPTNYSIHDKTTLAKVRLDIVGLNYYSPRRAKAPSKMGNKSKFDDYFEDYKMPNRRENKFRGWEIYPEAVYDTLKAMFNKYGSRIEYMLTEFGMGVENEGIFRDENGIIQDEYRVSFIKEHLEHLHRAMEDGVNIIGAHLWAIIDCWSWGNAFKNRYGLIEVDLENNLTRRYKKSAYFMKDLIETREIKLNYKKMEHYMDFDKIKFSKSRGM
ncbi:glycoside hydrolase family 1 protein [Mycoplasma marinum]|uniref:6-phospho-beta-glucosidase n=1 Tax=Mycoplasma marinum TaxID=1937190 RepID=A0A4R0XLZ6_9MOLU|nr:glycoside hydrolase family 1 protein [Mycoplasma marinum]TCG11534.1 6-phospho-beta-glucosidase [Mycoplasma marinum]